MQVAELPVHLLNREHQFQNLPLRNLPLNRDKLHKKFWGAKTIIQCLEYQEIVTTKNLKEHTRRSVWKCILIRTMLPMLTRPSKELIRRCQFYQMRISVDSTISLEVRMPLNVKSLMLGAEGVEATIVKTWVASVKATSFHQKNSLTLCSSVSNLKVEEWDNHNSSNKDHSVSNVAIIITKRKILV